MSKFDPQSVRDTSRRFYERVYGNAKKVPPDKGKHADVLAEMLRSAVCTTDFAMLDIGCGMGKVARLAKHLFPEASVHGTDISESIICRAREQYPQVEFKVAGDINLPYADELFDILTCRQSIHHYPDMIAHLDEVRRVLKPGGVYLIIDIAPEEGEYDRLLNQIFLSAEKGGSDNGHVKLYTVAEYEEFFEKTGFALQDVRFFQHPSNWVKDRPYFREIYEGMADSPMSFRQAIDFSEDDDRFRFSMRAAGILARKV